MAPPPPARDHARLLGEFVRQPARTGAVAPSSRWLAERLLEDVGLEEARTVVELGPGTGSFTRLIAERAHPRAHVLALELNPRLAAALGRRFPRVEIVNDSAEHLSAHLRARGREHADCILSGLPFATLSEERKRRVLDAIVEGLAPRGRFVTYAYLPMVWLPPGRRLRRFLEARFARVVTSPVVWRNVPPALVYRCEK